MKYNSAIHHRRSIRMKGYDYSQTGAYFITACAQNRECLFGEIEDGKMRLNEAGRILQTIWDALPDHYRHVEIDAWVIMPNHIHGIIILNPVGAGFKPALTDQPDIRAGVRAGSVRAGSVRVGLKPAPTVRHGLPEIVRALKSFSSRRINEWRNTPGGKLWQRNYWERVLRDETELNTIREYINNNPARWELDKLFAPSSESNIVKRGPIKIGVR